MTNPTSNEDTIKLFVLGSGWGVPLCSSAPFPVKLATWMRMAKIPFEIVVENNLGKAPKGKSPWVEINGEVIADSSIIIEHLADKYGVELDAHVSKADRAVGVAVQRMLEEHYHQCFEHQLFFGHGGRERMQEFADSMPIPIRWLLPLVAGRAFAKQLHARGMGRHPEEVIIAQGKADLDALSELLGDKRFFLGDTPSSIDACIFGFLGVTVYVTGDNPLFRHAASHDNLMRYTERMRERFFPETLEKMPAKYPAEESGVKGEAKKPAFVASVASC